MSSEALSDNPGPITSRTPRSTHIGRAVWSFGDQALSSASNFGATILAAHLLSPTGFGGFTLGFSAYIFTRGISYAVAAEPFQVRFAHAVPGRRERRAQRSALGTALLLGVIALIILAVASAVTPSTLRGPFLAIGISMPGLLVQDSLRSIYFAKGRPKNAAVNDGVWIAGATLSALAIAEIHGLHSPALIIGAWSSGAWIASLVGCVHLRQWPDFTQAGMWLSTNRDIAPSFCLDFLAMSGATLAVIYVLPFLVGVAPVGGLRGAQLFFGPLSILLQGSRIFGVPEGVRLKAEGPAKLWRASLVYTAFFVLISTVYSAVVVFLPPSLGERVLGASWHLASPLRPFLALSAIGGAMALGSFQGLRALGVGRRILRARALDAPTTVALGCLGAVLDGVRGATAGMGIANILVAGMWIIQFRRACNEMVLKPQRPIQTASLLGRTELVKHGPDDPVASTST